MNVKRKIKRKLKLLAVCCLTIALPAGLAGCNILPESIGQEQAAETASQIASEGKQAETETIPARPKVSDPDQPDKTESVYVKAGATGKAEDITVDVTLKNPGDDQKITDITSLEHIKNKQGDEEFSLTAEGELTWENHGEDIFYEGKSNGQLPVDVSLTYYLDGEEISPENLAGKSGQVKIRFDYQVNATEKVTVSEEIKDAQVPFAVMSMMVLPGDHFDSIQVDNGRAIAMDEQTVVIGYAMPGLADSMNLAAHEMTEEIDIPDYVEVTAYATDFELDFTATVITNGIFKEIKEDDLKDFDDTIDDMHELADASKELVDGTKELADGAGTFGDYLAQYTDGVSSLSEGAGQLSKGAKTLNDNKGALADGAAQLKDGLAQLDEMLAGFSFDSTGMMDQVMAQLKEQIEAQISARTAQMQAMASEAAGGSAYQAALQTLSANEAFAALSEEERVAIAGQIAAATRENFDAGIAAQESNSESASLDLDIDLGEAGSDESIDQLKTAVHALAEGSQALYDGILKYNEGVSGISDGAGQLYEGAKKLDSAGSELTKGYGDLTEGTKKLHEGFEEFDKEGIQEITKMADEDLKDLLDRVRTMRKADQSYNTFSGLREGQTGSVRCIVETAEIKP